MTQAHVHITDAAWEHLGKQRDLYGYHGNGGKNNGTHPGRTMGMSVYLKALFTVNPLHTDWTDTRPQEAKSADLARLTHNKFPIWHDEGELNIEIRGHRRARPKRSLNAEDVDFILPIAVPIARHYGITAIMGTQTAPRARLSALLEAIGLQWLTPKHAPPYNPMPRNMKRVEARAQPRHHTFELVF